MSSFPERLKSLREARGWNRLELSDRSGVDNASIGRYERGDREPTASNLVSLAKALNISMDYLMGLTDKPQGKYNPLSTTAWAAAQLIDSVQDEKLQQWALKLLAAALERPIG